MFFERNLPVDVLSSRELALDDLQFYRLIIVPYPLMLTSEEARILKAYVSAGGHLFVEARAGWVDDRGHAQPRVPGFGWDEMLGVHEEQLIPKKEYAVKWGAAQFKATTFEERFAVGDHAARALAVAEDDTPIAYENRYQKGRAIVFGGFVGEQNYQHPVAMHPLAGLLAEWSGLSRPKLRAPARLELRQMYAPNGRWVFFFNHGDKPAAVEFARTLERPASNIREVATGRQVAHVGTELNLKGDVPAESVRIYRIDF
jgi:beta-galactosidase GanA